MNHYVVARRAITNHGTQRKCRNFGKLQATVELGGMNNWLYAVMAIFAQRFNICNPKFWRQLRLSTAPGNND